MERIGTWFGLATAIAAVVTIVGYLVSRYSRTDEFFAAHWEFIAAAVGVLVFGGIVTAVGVRLFYSVDFAFHSGAGVLSVLLALAGLALMVLAGLAIVLVLTGNDVPI